MRLGTTVTLPMLVITAVLPLAHAADAVKPAGEKELARGFARTRIAAVGPVVAAAIEALGATVAMMPQSSFHMKPLVTAIATALREIPARNA